MTDADPNIVLAAWRAGRNTAEIAAKHGYPESEVASIVSRDVDSRHHDRVAAARHAQVSAFRQMSRL